MIDNFALGLSHGLILLVAWLLVRRDDLDHEPGARGKKPVPGKVEGPPRA